MKLNFYLNKNPKYKLNLNDKIYVFSTVFDCYVSLFLLK